MRWDPSKRESGTYSAVRSHGRHQVEIGVRCERGSARSIRGVVRDLSLSGLCVESFDAPEYGETVVVCMRLPGAEVDGRFRAIVRWARRGEFGVEFSGLTTMERMELARVVRHLLCARAS